MESKSDALRQQIEDMKEQLKEEERRELGKALRLRFTELVDEKDELAVYQVVSKVLETDRDGCSISVDSFVKALATGTPAQTETLRVYVRRGTTG